MNRFANPHPEAMARLKLASPSAPPAAPEEEPAVAPARRPDRGETITIRRNGDVRVGRGPWQDISDPDEEWDLSLPPARRVQK